MKHPVGTLVRVYLGSSSERWPQGCLAIIIENDRDITETSTFPYRIRNCNNVHELTWHKELKPVEDNEGKVEWMLQIMKH